MPSVVGSIEKASYIIREAARAKADAISVHLTSMKDYMVPQYGTGKGRVSAGKENIGLYPYLESINLVFDAWKKLILEARDLGLDICVMCNDWSSFEFAEDIDPEIYVISASAFMEEEFIRNLAKTNKPLLLTEGPVHG